LCLQERQWVVAVVEEQVPELEREPQPPQRAER
jgi:hypothetical protein